MDEAAWQPRAFLHGEREGKKSPNWMADVRFLHFYYANGPPYDYRSASLFTVSYHPRLKRKKTKEGNTLISLSSAKHGIDLFRAFFSQISLG